MGDFLNWLQGTSFDCLGFKYSQGGHYEKKDGDRESAVSRYFNLLNSGNRPTTGGTGRLERSGDEFIIELRDGKSVKGKVTSVVSDEISLTRKNKSETVRQDSIARIYHKKRKVEKGKKFGVRRLVAAFSWLVAVFVIDGL